MVAQNYVLRSIYLEPEVDDFLRDEAFERKISKNEVIREYIQRGLRASVKSADESSTKSTHFTAMLSQKGKSASKQTASKAHKAEKRKKAASAKR